MRRRRPHIVTIESPTVEGVRAAFGSSSNWLTEHRCDIGEDVFAVASVIDEVFGGSASPDVAVSVANTILDLPELAGRLAAGRRVELELERVAYLKAHPFDEGVVHGWNMCLAALRRPHNQAAAAAAPSGRPPTAGAPWSW